MAKTSTLLACAALALVLSAPLSADAGPKQEARVHIDRATKAHKAGDLEKALTELQAAYALDPQPQLLYATGQIFTKLGRCSEASDAYLRFLASGADARTAQLVKQAIESCKAGGATEPAAEPKEPAAEPKQPATPRGPAKPTSDEEDPLAGRSQAAAKVPPPAKQPPPARASSKRRVATLNEPGPAGPPEPEGARPFYSDVLGDVLVVGGGASLVLGYLAYRAAKADLDTAETVNTLERYQELVDGAHTKRVVGATMAGVGAVLVTAGVLRFMLRDKHTEVRRVGVVPSRGGGLMTWTRSF
jgi:tetratricopeptide (TPR) repeat protein